MKREDTVIRSVDQRARILFGAAFVLKAVILFVVFPNVESLFAGKYTVGFADGYDRIANNLARGYGYRSEEQMAETMIREPGYPLFLAAIIKLCGYSIQAARWANWLLMVGIAVMLRRLAQRVTYKAHEALVASLLFIFYPGTLIAEARAGVEILFICAILMFMLALDWAIKKGGLVHFLAAGLLLGAVFQVRGSPFLFPALLLLYWLLVAKGARERVRAAANVAVLVTGAAIVVAPWVIRNYLLADAVVVGGTVRGVVLHTGQYICRHLTWSNDYHVVLSESGRERAEIARQLGLRVKDASSTEPQFYDCKDEVRFSNTLVKRGLMEYVAHPNFLASSIAKNMVYFFILGKTRFVTALNALLQLPLLVLAVMGLNVLRKRGILDRMGIMLTFVLSILMVHLPVNSEARYSVPIFTFLVIPASVALMTLLQRYRFGLWVRNFFGVAEDI